MNTDQIAAEAADEMYPSRLSREWQIARETIKSAIEKATERKDAEMKSMNERWERLHKQLQTEALRKFWCITH